MMKIATTTTTTTKKNAKKLIDMSNFAKEIANKS